MRFPLHILIVIFVSAGMLGCSVHKPKSTEEPQPVSSANQSGYSETGKASFYANKHQMKRTANGEKYDYHLSTAAHRSLPFGTMLKVTNIDNGKIVVVRINDRGPYVKGRIIDLSKSAFDSIANQSTGVIDVKIELAE